MKEYKEIYKDIINQGITMVSEERFETILRYKDNISKIDGDIVECGVWAGGMSIFLSKLFPTKKIWVCDSYEGCQNPSDGDYYFENEKHTKGMYSISLETVKDNFIKNNLPDDKRINFLKGWVKDTLKPEICPIKDIALLRIDVDSYSATLEVLDYLYSKVKSGGIIIFDDSCLSESHHAMITFLEKKPNIIFKHTSTGETIDIKSGNSLPCGCYFIKP
jgi:O-methyltransferase/macrocin O-methyltransferase/8-demethyl-8-(2,3-dimethoxy-alpha-L-rhamnosyl)tetracenomycin-C 4'-O-methyltransferase